MTSDQIYEWLEEVKDPEIPVLSLVDLGVITEVAFGNNTVRIEMTPTFVGCPALDMMKSEIESVLQNHGVEEVQIIVTYQEPWTSDRISRSLKTLFNGGGASPNFFSAAFPFSEILSDVQGSW